MQVLSQRLSHPITAGAAHNCAHQGEEVRVCVRQGLHKAGPVSQALGEMRARSGEYARCTGGE